MYKDVIAISERRRLLNAHATGGYAPRFNVGDYVLVGRVTPKGLKLEVH